ncbi:MAG: hypothetical protein V3U76_03115 [Granulosicoccus sp.]
MTSRNTEQRLVQTCVRVAAGEFIPTLDKQAANVIRLAAMLARSNHPVASMRLRDVANDYFSGHGVLPLATEELLRRRWVISLPRFRSLLDRELATA